MSVNNINQRTLLKAARFIAWAGVFLFFDLNINEAGLTVQLMSKCTGWLLYIYAFDNLCQEVRQAQLLRPVAIIICVIEFIRWLLHFIIMTELPLVVYVFEAVLSLYFHFQIFSDVETAARNYHLPCADSILVLRSLLVVFTTVIHLINLFSHLRMNLTWVNLSLLSLNMIVAAGIMIIMFEFVSQLKKAEITL